MTDTPKVTQADREAAWPFRPACYTKDDKAAWMAGRYDNLLGPKKLLQAFARHRLTTAPAGDGLAGELLRLIEARQMGSVVRESEGDNYGHAARRVASANTEIADWLGEHWPTILTALRQQSDARREGIEEAAKVADANGDDAVARQIRALGDRHD